MNRFRKNKKAKEAKEAVEYDHAPIPSSTSKPSKKNKKEQVEPKEKFDLENALPSSDDFRTSLLMPNLSARFSMLKEQDDPTTKVGKANDDSVLFPKRVSRLNLFGHNPNNLNPLADIAEVASLHGRPSLNSGRTDSFASGGDGYDTDDNRPSGGSVMTRARPGEGNNLFGGRQKVYKIPVSASRNVSNPESAASGGLRGRAVYEDDVTLSAFQRLRLKEKEERLAETMERLHGSTTTDSPEPSPGAFATNRTTASSTASGPSNRRTSTAATSIDEQSSSGVSSDLSTSKANIGPPGPDRSATKTRRLYGQGLEQTAQNQQSSAFSRFESLNRQRTGTLETPPLNRSYSRSATNLHEKLQKLAPVKATAGYRDASPPPSATSPGQQSMERNPSELGSGSNPGSAVTGYGFIPPLSPPVSETDDAVTLAAALQPEDRGKATAMGLFNKPSSKYDEQQFTRRQLQMHEGRNTPPLRRRSPPRGISQPGDTGRARGLSNTSYRSKAESASSRYSGEAYRTGDNSAAPSVRESSPPRPANRTFFTNFSGSESGSESDSDNRQVKKPSPTASQAFGDVHPALRPSTGSSEDDATSSTRGSHAILPEVRYSDLRDLNPIAENEADGIPLSPALEEASEKAPDSPTLGPSGLGLSGLIRTHLRHDSDKSSIYPLPSPGFSPKHGERNRDSNFVGNSTSDFHLPGNIHSSPWDYNELENNSAAVEDSLGSISQQNMSPAMSSMSIRAKQMLEQAAAIRAQDGQSQADYKKENLEQEDYLPWQEELRSKHRRSGSTETQKEREEFENELAERRKRVHEKLKTFAESESRSSSPAPGRSTPDLKHGNAFAMLKNKSVKKQESAPSKSKKILGLGNATMSASTPSLVSDDPWREEEEKVHHELGKHPNSSSPHVGSGKNIWSRARAMRRGSREESRESSLSRGPSPQSHSSYQRDGSESDVSGRSKSRTRYREDLEKVEEDTVSQHTSRSSGEPPESRGPISVPASTRPSVDVNDRGVYERSTSAASGSYRSNSRSAAPGHLDISPINSAQTTNPVMLGISPRPSPVTPYSANATPPLYELSENSAASTTSLQSGSHSIPQRAPGSNGLHKRVIDKTQISEPTFVSSTSNVPTVGLPPGASLSNGMESPPIPPMNPRRRRQTTTQTILGALKGEKYEAPPMPSENDTMEEHSTFSDDGEKRPKTLHRLRNISSEGGSLNAKARKEAMMGPSPTLPQSTDRARLEGGMF